MRLMTALADDPARVLGAGHLRKGFRLGDVLFMAARAEHRGIGQLRYHRTRVLGVLGQRAMAGFAVDAHMLARFLYGQHVAVTVFTGLVTGKDDWFGSKLGQRGAAIVAILSKALGNKVCPDQQKHHDHDRTRYRQLDEMSGVFKFTHSYPSQTADFPR